MAQEEDFAHQGDQYYPIQDSTQYDSKLEEACASVQVAMPPLPTDLLHHAPTPQLSS